MYFRTVPLSRIGLVIGTVSIVVNHRLCIIPEPCRLEDVHFRAIVGRAVHIAHGGAVHPKSGMGVFGGVSYFYPSFHVTIRGVILLM